MASFGTIVADTFRVLTFRRPSAALRDDWPACLAFGLLCTLLAGIGRYWDNPRAELWQGLGLGSVAYVFVLAFVLWLIALPLRPERWSYVNVLLFVTLTSPPALLYAVPIEQFMPLGRAQQVNAVFLLIVAAWRVALLFWFLRVFAGLSTAAMVVAALLPLVLITGALTVFNLEHVIFKIMAGNDPSEPSGNDGAFLVVALLALLAQLLAPFLLIAYGWQIHRARQRVPPPF
jgi:hypothetical protein